MIKSFRVKDNLFINQVSVEGISESALTPVPTHQFIIIDRSGSMYRELDNICDIIIKYVDTLVEGSTVSVGYFSSEGEYGLSVPYTLKKELDGVKNTVDSYRSDLGCTCFTEILHKVKENVTKPSNLYFFTDGCHNEGPFEDVIKELESLKPDLTCAMFVGCGYIDRDNMNQMASTVDGSFIHLSKFSEFEQSLYDFKDGVEDSVPSILVNVDSDQENICSVIGKQVVSYSVKDNKISFRPSTKKTQVYYCTSSKALGEVSDPGKNEVPFRTLAFYLVQHNKTPLALDILNFLGDKFLIKKLYNCFTSDEYSKVEQQLRSSIFYSKNRYKEGKVENYLPDDNAFSVLDALDIITKDDNALLDLSDSEFEYTKISRSTEQTDGSKLIYPKTITANANKLVYNKEALNVSLQLSFNAEVPLNVKEFKESGIEEAIKSYSGKLPKTQKVKCIKNYSIISDAKLNTPKLVLSKISKSTVNELGKYLNLRDDNKYVLDLSQLPLINKSYLKDTSAKLLAEKCWLAKDMGTDLSVLRYLMKSDTGTYESTDKGYEELLEKFYIKNGIYQPPKKVTESKDFYMHYEFLINFKGYSDASASSVIKKINEGKKLTDREIPVQIAYDKYKNFSSEELKSAYDSILPKYRDLNTQIQHAKFAILLINRGSMPEFESRDNMVLNIDTKIGNELKSIPVKFDVVTKPVKL